MSDVNADAIKIIEKQIDEKLVAFEGKIKGDFDNTEIKKQLTAKDAEILKLNDNVATLSTQLDSVQATQKSQGNLIKKGESLDDIVEKSFEKIKSGVPTEFTIKASVLESNAITSNTIALRDNELSPLAHRTLTMYDIFRKKPVGANTGNSVRYVDWDTDTTARAAAAVAEGAAFPESTARWVELSVELQKIGDTIPVSEEMLFDQARFTSELAEFLTRNVDLKIDNDLLSGNGTAPNIKGLLTYAPTFTAAASGITAANIYDLIEKVDESITLNKGSKFAPNVVLMTIADINKMKLSKDTHNNYIMPPFIGRNGQEVGGKTIIRNDNIPTNTLYVGDGRYGTIYESTEGYSVSVGEVNAQFTSDMKTIKARKRLALLIKNSEVAAWRRVSSISLALTTLAT